MNRDRGMDSCRSIRVMCQSPRRILLRTVIGVEAMADEGEKIQTFEQMPRPRDRDEFAIWLVPARNNIQREMLRLRPILSAQPFVGFPIWVVHSRHLVLGACFSLWRSVFQAGVSPPNKMTAEDGERFLDQIIHNNAATYGTELNPWSLEYYVENAVFRICRSRKIAIDAGIDPNCLPEAHMFGESDKEDKDYILRSDPFTPYGEWEECFIATHALISAMIRAMGQRDD